MDSRIDAIYGRQSIDKKDSISIESQFEFCRYELKGGEGKEYKDKCGAGRHTVLIPSPSSWTGSRQRSWWKMRKWILLS